MSRTRVAAGAICSLALAGSVFAQDPPLPEGNAYVRGVIGSSRPQDAAVNDYSYDIEEIKEELDKGGTPSSHETRRYEVYFVKTRPVRRLVSVDGAPLGKKEQAEVDRKAESQAQAIAGGRTVSEQAGIRLSLLLDSFDFKTLAREDREGRRTLVFAFEPRKDAPPGAAGNQAANAVTKMLSGKLHIDEADRRVVRLEAASAPGQKASVATGVKLQAFELLMEFATVQDGVWLPRKVVTLATGRAFFFKTFRVRRTTSYSNYRKFRVDTRKNRRARPRAGSPGSTSARSR